jgi:hypothetical protein
MVTKRSKILTGKYKNTRIAKAGRDVDLMIMEGLVAYMMSIPYSGFHRGIKWTQLLDS